MADLDLTVTRAVPVTDHKMVGESVLHVSDTKVVDIENARVPLTGATVMHDDIFPPSLADGCPVDGGPCGGVQVGIGAA